MIQLPGYKAKLPNEAYVSERPISSTPERKDLRGLLLLNRFEEPTLNETLTYLASTANRVVANLEETRSRRIHVTGETEMVLYRYPRLAHLLTQSNFETIETLSRAWATLHLTPSVPHMNFAYATVENQAIQKTTTYMDVLALLESEHRHAEPPQLAGRIRIDEHGELPDLSYIAALAQHATPKSKALELIQDPYDSAQLTELLETIYSGIRQPQDLALLSDRSSSVTEIIGFRTLNAAFLSLNLIQPHTEIPEDGDGLDKEIIH